MDVTMLPRLLDASGNEVRRINPISVSITENAVPLSTATMKLPKNESIPDRSYVELFTPNGSAGVYRTRTPSKGWGNFNNEYSLEHAICEVGDWLVRASIDQTEKTLSQAITQVFGYYGGSKWQLGTVSATGNVILSAKYSNVLQTINSLIDQVSGALMTFDFSTTPWTMNVVGMSNTVTAEGRLSRNITNAQIKKDDTNLCTRVWLNGTKYDADTIVTYGVIEKKIQDKDYTSTQAATVANSYLEKYKNPIYSITIDGMDFHNLTSESLDEIKIGKLYRLAIPEDSVILEQYIVKVDWRDVYNQPNVVSITLNESNKKLVDFIQKQSSDLYGAEGYYNYQESEKEKIWSKFTTTDAAITAEVGRATTAEQTIDGRVTTVNETLSSRITQTANAITAEVTRATTAEQTIDGRITTETTTLSTRITQNAESITAEATRASTAEGNLSSRITQNANSISSEVTRATTAEGSLSTRITQNADSISSEVTRATTAEGTLSSRITQEAGRIDLVVTGTGYYAEINVGGIVRSINDQNTQSYSFVKIDADMVDIDGSVVVSTLESDFDDLVDGTLWADTLSTQSLWTYGLHVIDPQGGQASTMEIFGQNVGWVDLTIDGNVYRFLILNTI